MRNVILPQLRKHMSASERKPTFKSPENTVMFRFPDQGERAAQTSQALESEREEEARHAREKREKKEMDRRERQEKVRSDILDNWYDRQLELD